MTTTGRPEDKVPLWRDERFQRIAIQALVLAILVLIGSVMLGNMTRNLQQLGRQFDFGFLKNQAGFNIGESLLPYQTNDTYGWALFIGFVNTLRLILVGFVLATIAGVVAGIASFSDNWLVRKLNLVYVEIVRNTPLLLQLFFWYFVIFFGLSQGAEIVRLLGFSFLSKKGVVIPWPANTLVAWLSSAALVLLAIAAFLIWRWRTRLMEETGASGRPQQMVLLGTGVVFLLIFCFGLGWSFPHLTEANAVEGGLRVSLEYAAMLGGLTFYTGAFIAEIVRAGIQSVSKGQWEAARSLGLKTSLAMRLVVFPQALRVMIPSLNSQYANLAKNSSLALAIGYPDIFSTAQTTLNQTGRAVEVVMLVMVVYLIVNLIISLVMNQINRTVQIAER
ncbi:MAG TPA: ABC transporter permease subunit [Leptolyngbyaceae cyanobacterium]